MNYFNFSLTVLFDFCFVIVCSLLLHVPREESANQRFMKIFQKFIELKGKISKYNEHLKFELLQNSKRMGKENVCRS